jgi:acetyl esterase/lipase
MKHVFFILLLLVTANSYLMAQNRETLLLWPQGPSESNEITEPEVIENDRISNVSIPSMTFYRADPAKNTGIAILIVPGGGYIRQAAGHEGSQFGEWLSANGINAFVLKYRLPNKHAWIPLRDAQQAMRIIRSRAPEWKIDPSKVGVSGFSAGGHLASALGTHFDYGTPVIEPTPTKTKSHTKVASVLPVPAPVPVSSFSCRPDFMILFYPVISMQESVTHGGSRENLLGTKYQKDSVDYYSNELHVTKDTPPTLLFLSDDDGAVPPQNSIDFYTALKENKVPASLHIFPEGGHGWGFRETFRYHEIWKTLYMDWLKERKILN